MKNNKHMEPKSGQSDFFERVYGVVRLIPFGKVTSYGAIARFLGSGRAARLVGFALNSCHSSENYVPAHRVVNRKGVLTGKNHFGNSTTMRQLLENEGLIIENDQVLNFVDYFWDPCRELQFEQIN